MKLFVHLVLLLICFQGCGQTTNEKSNKMKVAVWDTYVTKKDGNIMHFDILVPENVKETSLIYNYGKDYLSSKGQEGQPLTSKECRFCHVESLKHQWEEAINKQGYFIIEMENCNKSIMPKSAFDLAHQHSSIESKIVASLERVSQALRVLLWNEGKEFSLSPIQIQVLIFLLHHDDIKRKVSYLADEFNMTKATVSETIKTLKQKKLIRKEDEKHDSRSYIIHLTRKGKKTAELTSLFAKEIQFPIDRLHSSDKENLLLSLLDIIHHLNKAGVITIQRICYTCHFYKSTKSAQGHFCQLLNSPLEDHELRIDCPEHTKKETA